MNITEEDKQAVIDALASNPKVSSYPTFYSDLLAKTEFKSGKLNAVKEALLKDGRIWQDYEAWSGRRVIHLIIVNKRQQILDILKQKYMDNPLSAEVRTYMLKEHCKITPAQVHDILIELAQEGMITIDTMFVNPSQRLKDEIAAAAPATTTGTETKQ